MDYKKQLKTSVRYGLVLLTTLFSASALSAITPNHVFQVVDTAVNELNLMHASNESTWKASGFSTTGRKPRHVIQKGREVFLRVQELRALYGLPEEPIPVFPAKEITPGNVKEIVDKIAESLMQLRDEFDVEAAYAEAALPTGKTPNDVYIHLQLLNDLLNGLDLPVVVPNDVYRVATVIIDELKQIRDSQGINSPLATLFPAKRKTPGDVYSKAETLLATLKSICGANKQLCPKGGIVVPPKPQGSITPATVLNMMNNILADIGSIKLNLGVTKLTILPNSASGQTPSSVFDALSTAQALANTLNSSE